MRMRFVPVALLFVATVCSNTDPVVVAPPSTGDDSTFTRIRPFWSADGKRILFFGNVFPFDWYDLYDVDLAGGPARLLMRDSLAKTSPVLSPDGRKIAYAAAPLGRLICCGHVWVMNVDGGSPRDLTPFGGSWEYMRWSPDSRTVIFDGGVEDSGVVNYQIVTADAETDEIKVLTSGNYGNRDASYLADGKRIVHLSGRLPASFGGKVWLMNSDGSAPVPVDTSSVASAWPRPAPVGGEMLFAWGFGGESEAGTYAVDLDTVTFPVDSFSLPRIGAAIQLNLAQWSPDGRSVLYPYATSSTRTDLYVMDKDGSNIRRLTTDFIVYLFSYAWSPDSRVLVFSASDDANLTISFFTYDLMTSELKKLIITRE